MKKTSIFLIFVLTSIITFGQIPKWTNLKLLAGKGYDEGTCIKIDKKRNYYIACDLTNAKTVGIDSLAIDCSGVNIPQLTRRDGFLLRYDSLRKLNLALRVPSGFIRNVGVDTLGNIFISGNTTYGASYDGFLIKYSAFGNILWSKKLESYTTSRIADASITSMDVLNDGTMVICGFTYGTEASIFGYIVSGPINFVAKVSSEGNVIWVNSISSTLGYGPYRAKFDKVADVVVAGNERDSIANQKLFICKLNGLTGIIIWKKIYPTTSNLWVPAPFCIGIQSDTYLFGGSFGGDISFDGNKLLSRGKRDIFILQTDTSGTVKWSKSAGSLERDDLYDITSTPSDDIVLTGGYSNGFLFNGVSYASKGNLDVYIASLDKLGNSLWLKTGGSNLPNQRDDFFYNELGFSLALDSQNNVEIVGTIYGSGNFGTLKFNASEKTGFNFFWLSLGEKENNYTISIPCIDTLPQAIQDTSYNISLFPNPFSNQLTIKNSKNKITNYRLIFYNNLGQKVREFDYNGISTIELSSLAYLSNGNYYLSVTTPDFSKAFKLVKK